MARLVAKQLLSLGDTERPAYGHELVALNALDSHSRKMVLDDSPQVRIGRALP